MDFKYVFYSQQNQRVTGTSRKVRILFITINFIFLIDTFSVLWIHPSERYKNRSRYQYPILMMNLKMMGMSRVTMMRMNFSRIGHWHRILIATYDINNLGQLVNCKCLKFWILDTICYPRPESNSTHSLCDFPIWICEKVLRMHTSQFQL